MYIVLKLSNKIIHFGTMLDEIYYYLVGSFVKNKYISSMRLHVFKVYKICCDTNLLHSETSSGKIIHYCKRRHVFFGFTTKFQVGFNETALIPLRHRSDTAQTPLRHCSDTA